jgi:hypothetical protein
LLIAGGTITWAARQSRQERKGRKERKEKE